MVKHLRSGSPGWTSTEAALAVALAGVLAFVLLPQYFQLSAQAEVVARDAVASAVQSGLDYARERSGSGGKLAAAPVQLDAVADGQKCGGCFAAVLPQGLNDARWQRITAQRYAFNDGNQLSYYVYDAGAGVFSPAPSQKKGKP